MIEFSISSFNEVDVTAFESVEGGSKVGIFCWNNVHRVFDRAGETSTQDWVDDLSVYEGFNKPEYEGCPILMAGYWFSDDDIDAYGIEIARVRDGGNADYDGTGDTFEGYGE